MKINNTLLNNPQVKEKVSKIEKKYMKLNKNKTKHTFYGVQVMQC